MLWKTTFGTAFPTEAILAEVEERKLKYFSASVEKKETVFTYQLSEQEYVYGLGETTGPCNKRGRRYISFNTDTADHSESNPSLYASHNFLLMDGGIHLGVFFDTPSRCTFEIDWHNSGEVKVICDTGDVTVYTVEGESNYQVVREFLRAIGPCYLPPLWAFGYGQSRFGYQTEQDFLTVMEGYQKNNIPLDYICMDINYMDGFADFSVDTKSIPSLKALAEKTGERGIHLVPIVDAGIKIQPGDPVYESGVEGEHFCRNKEDKLFQAAVWPGMTHFPDFLNPDARRWFGEQYRFYTEQGIEGFWNDMNEPAIFYSEYTNGFDKLRMILDMLLSKKDSDSKKARLMRDYRSFYHNANGKRYCHYDVHNIYGYMMTRATSEGLEKLLPHRFMLFSRSSYIGASRYGGIWTGDNTSCWEHLLLLLRQLPALNMCGFLYSGSDTGGFCHDCSRELLLRWLAVSAFTPLMRNHSNRRARNQECYEYGDTADFASVVSFRYRLLPYIYSEYMKAALSGDMYIKPLSFLFPEDEKARDIEDQLLVGDSLMMTPIIHEGETKRTVYLPEDMTMVRYDGKDFHATPVSKGELTIEAQLNEIVFFILKNKLVPVGKAITNTSQLDWDALTLLGDGEEYRLYQDDGLSRNCSLENIKTLRKE